MTVVLPESALDRDSYPSGPDGMAMICRDRIAELEQWRTEAVGAKRKAINQQLRTIRSLMRFAVTRAGYTGVLGRTKAA